MLQSVKDIKKKKNTLGAFDCDEGCAVQIVSNSVSFFFLPPSFPFREVRHKIYPSVFFLTVFRFFADKSFFCFLFFGFRKGVHPIQD